MVAELKLVSPEEYLARERAAEYKSEYVNGYVLAMAGGTKTHSLVSGNVHNLLNTTLRDAPCLVFNSDMKVRVPSSFKFHYPDVSAVCGEATFADNNEDVLLNPQVIIEVLSVSTSAYDRGKKFQYYQEIPSFHEYLLIAQDEPVVERYVKQPDGNWLYTKFAGLESSVELPILNCHLALREIYAKVEWPEAAD